MESSGLENVPETQSLNEGGSIELPYYHLDKGRLQSQSPVKALPHHRVPFLLVKHRFA